MVIVNCKRCWKEFNVAPSRAWKIIYCSKECRVLNLEWKRVWRLTVLWEQKVIKWVLYEKCLCDCWTEKFIQRRYLLNDTVESCWCYRKETTSKTFKTHWDTWSKLYKAFLHIKWRCECETDRAYKRYWLRWIKCEWEDYEHFKEDMYDEYVEHIEKFWAKNTTIDRIDVNWNYCKDNCRWATCEEQSNNTRRNHYVEYNWERMTISELCKKYSLQYKLILWRLNRWRTLEQAINVPKRQNKDFITKE